MGAVREACTHVVGAYGLAVVCADEPGVIAVARKDSPIIIGRGERGSYVASDVIAVIDATRDVVVLEDGQFARLTREGITYTDAEGNAIEPAVTHIDWDIDMAEKGGYPDFMLKEICEQPRVVRDTLVGRMTGGELDIDELGLTMEELNLIDRVYVIACGTSYHAGLIAKNLIEMWARIPCEVEAASEFRYRNPIITPSTLVVAVSQSGETADTLAAIRDARIKGAKVFGITNVVGSPVARESDGVIYTKANKEIAVASTKSFIGQVVSLTLLALLLAQVKGKLTTGQVRLLFSELGNTAEQIQWILDTQEEAIHEAAPGLQGCALGALCGARYGRRHRQRGRSQAQRDQLPACGGVRRGRDEARPPSRSSTAISLLSPSPPRAPCTTKPSPTSRSARHAAPRSLWWQPRATRTSIRSPTMSSTSHRCAMPSAPSRLRCRCSYSRARWPSCAGAMWTSPRNLAKSVTVE